jgi:hypothetical protein
MTRPRVPLLIGVATVVPFLVLRAPPVWGSVPSSGQSTFGDCLGVSPKNTTAPPGFRYRYTGTLRDANGAPVVNFPPAMVWLDFSNCMNPSTRPSDRIEADGPSDANGNIHWEYMLTFGGADPCAVEVRVQNVVFHVIPGHQGLPAPEHDGGVRSPDVNGDDSVALADLRVFQQAFVQQEPGWRGDFDCDGVIALGDLSFFQRHFVAP